MNKKILKFIAIILVIAAAISAIYEITGILDSLDWIPFIMLCIVQASGLFVAYNLLFLRPGDFK
jgi:hypothetical protein